MSSAQPEGSNTPIPTTEGDNNNAGEEAREDVAPVESVLTNQQWDAFHELLSIIYNHRTADGHDPSKVFQRKPNKRVYPAYYEVIKEPIALSTIKARLNLKQYKDISSVVREFALIPHNAQVYNRPDSGAYVDALEIKRVLEAQLKRLVDKQIVQDQDAELPYLGEIPEPDDPVEEAGDEEESEEDDSGDETDDSRGKRRGPGRPRKGSKPKVEAGSKEEADRVAEIEARKKRGRPPRVDTPMEARIKNILKAIRRPKLVGGVLKIAHFDRLPDKEAIPEYYNEIKNPMAVDIIKKRIKRKKYQSVEQFMKDVDLMFENAKLYNEDDSEIHNIAVELHNEARRVADEEINKPDTEFVDEEGRIPLPNGVMHNGELYKIGDWVHIQNMNDLTKPIPTQIYRTWQDAAGTKFVNACWYYRPEQTVHRFDKHFYENEIVKTGQYRDHQVDEIVDRCFVMFITRYGKGRPSGFPPDKEIYVCESRYNEEKHTFNKIKTWASCLPDEVRDQDYRMEMFKEQKRMKKLPSPIAYLLKDEQKDTDELPKPTWGADNAPPKIGAVHRRPRDPKVRFSLLEKKKRVNFRTNVIQDSPPPEPTPPPPPTPEVKTEPPKQPPSLTQIPQRAAPTNLPNAQALRAPSNTTTQTLSTSTSQQKPFPTNNSSSSLTRPASNHRGYNANAAQTPASRMNQNPNSTYTSGANRNTAASGSQSTVQNYQAPQPVEVYHLQDAVNNNIPPDIRSQFQCDDYGRILFFTAPPIDVRPTKRQGAGLGHSARYIAAMQRREEEIKEKRKRDDEERERQDEESRKSAKKREELLGQRARAVQVKAEDLWRKQMEDATNASFQSLYGEDWERRMAADLEALRKTTLTEMETTSDTPNGTVVNAP